jgi:hypothetical protein
MAVEVVAEAPAERPLLWVDLRDAAAHAAALRDGHLRTLAQRAAHALGAHA